MPVTLTNAYATKEQVKAAKGISDSVDDDIINIAINAASRQIDGKCGQRFWQDATVQTRTYVPTQSDWLDLLDTDDAAGISTTTGLLVDLDTADSGSYSQALTNGTDFYLEPLNAAKRTPVWPYTELRLSGLNYLFGRSAYGRALVRITAKFGWPAVPDDITQACIIQAQMLANSKNASMGFAALAAIDGAGMRALGWHPMAAALIGPYVRPAVG